MNVLQICQLIQAKVRAITWPGGTAPMFDTDSVRIIPQGDEIAALDENLIPPLCIISPLGGDFDPQHREEPTYVQRNIDITLVTVNTGDRVGEAPVVGANSADRITSPGRGLMELEEELFDAIAKLNIQQGVKIQLAAYGEGQVRRDQANNFVGIQDYTFQVWCSTTAEYSGGSGFTATGGTGDISLTWTNPFVTPSTYRGVLVRKTGASAPTSISDGTIVQSDPGLALSSYVDSGLLPGTYSYSFFVTYDDTDRPPNSDQIVSSPVSGTAIAS